MAHPDDVRPEDICDNCGTTTYTRADMVGNVCPICAAEMTLMAAVEEAFREAEGVKAQLADKRDEREKLAADARADARPVRPAAAKAKASAGV